MLENTYFAIFGGGGIRGLAYSGAFKALKENNIKLNGTAGSSIGAVFAGLYSIGYDFEEIFEMLSAIGLEIFRDINIDFKKEIAVSKGNIFYDWVKEKIEKKFYKENFKKNQMPPVCFKDIEKMGKKLVIFSVDLIKNEFFEFSAKNTPEAEIATAIRASVSMPGLFVPLEYEDKLLVDGDLLKAIPLWRVSKTIMEENSKIVEFRLEDNVTQKPFKNSLEYLNRVYNAICGFATDYIIDMYHYKDKFDYIKIDTPDISVVDFLIPKEKKQELFEIGYKTTSDYFRNYFPKKNKALKEKYLNILKKINDFQKEFNNKKYFNSYISLCEVFMILCEEKKYIDSEIYNLISNFKDNYKENFSIIKIFGFKTGHLKNADAIYSLMLDIIKQLTLKIEQLN